MLFKHDANECCSLLILRNFGEETPTYDDDSPFTVSPCAIDFRQFVERLRQKVNEFNYKKNNKSIVTNASRFEKSAIIQATTCSTQPKAEGFLREFGFQQFGPVAKEKHKKTELSVWLMTVADFKSKLAEHEASLDITPPAIYEGDTFPYFTTDPEEFLGASYSVS